MNTENGGIIVKSGLNANQLKLIAIAVMVLDHCAIVFAPPSSGIYLLLRVLGRMTAPIMCFFIAEGYHRTSDLKKYMGRLLVVAFAAHVPHNLCLGCDIGRFWVATSVMVSLLCGLIALAAWKSDRLPAVWLKMLIVGVCCLLSYSADWNYIAVFWILGFGIFYGNRNKQVLAYCCVVGIYMLQPFIHGYAASVIRLGVLLVIPLLYLYNGRRGTRCNYWMKWFFYWFYPMHFLVIHGIRILM